MVQETVEEKLARIERMTQLGFKPGAAQLCRLILEKEPRNLQALIWLARTTSQPEEASQALQQAQAIAPNDPMVRNLRASGIGEVAPSAPVSALEQSPVLNRAHIFIPAPSPMPASTSVNNMPNPNPYATNATPPANSNMAFNPYMPAPNTVQATPNQVNPASNAYSPNPTGTAASSTSNYMLTAQQAQPNLWPTISAGTVTTNGPAEPFTSFKDVKSSSRRNTQLRQIAGLVLIALGVVVGVYWAWQLIGFTLNINSASLNLTGQVTTLRSSQLDVNVPNKGDFSFESSPQLYNALAPLLSNPDGKSLAANSVKVYTSGKYVMWVDVVSPQAASTKDAVVNAGLLGAGPVVDWLLLVVCIIVFAIGLFLVRGTPRGSKAS